MRLLNTVSTLAILAAGALSATGARAQAVNTTPANVNVLNLISPFLSLNSTTVGQSTLALNLSQAIATNNGATPTQQALAISDKSIFNSATNTALTASIGLVGPYGVAANLAGGLPAQTPNTGGTNGTIIPQQPVGGLGSVLGPIYQRGVAAGNASPLSGTVALLVNAYNFTSSDLGVAKNYFANGAATNPSTTPAGYVAVPAVAPAGYTLPTANGLPNTTNSVYDLAYGVTNSQPTAPGAQPQDVYGDSRPVQVRPTGINQFDPTSIQGLATNPSFPSGHTNYAFTDSLLIGMLVPQDYQNMLLRASDYGNSRIVLGVHYPLDIIASRAFSAYDLAQAFTNPLYINNAATTGTVVNGTGQAINLPGLFNTAAAQIQPYLAAQCGASVATCSTSAANTANDPYLPSAANQALYISRLTYGLPTLTFAQAPREAAAAGGPDASILLAPVYGGSTTAATTIAPGGGLLANLQTSTINQIILNTENTAIAAFYGTSLSYWTRIDLYSAAGYFQNVTGTLSLATTDVVKTNVTIGSAGLLEANGTVTGATTVTNGGTLAGSGTVGAVAVNAGGILAPGSLAAQSALLAGTTNVSGTNMVANGAVGFAPGSTLNIFATSSQATSVVATGAVTIGGGTVAVQVQPNASFVPTQYLIVAGLNGVTGTFASASTNLPFLAASLSYDPNDVFLSINRSSGNLVAAAASNNQSRVALNLAFGPQPTTGNGGALLNAVFSQGSAAQAQATFDQLSGEGIVATQNAGIQAARVVTGAIGDQAMSWLTGGGGAANSITLGGVPTTVAQYAPLDAYPSPIVVDRPLAPRSYRVWATGFGGGQSISGQNGNTAGETGNFYGGVLGLDYQIQPNILVGVVAGGSDSTFNVASRSTTGDVLGAHGGVYSLVNFGPVYGLASETFSSFSNKTTRTVAAFGGLNSATEKASFGSTDIRTRAEFGRVLDYGNVYGFTGLKITPFVALEIAQLRTNGFSESNTNGTGNIVGLTSQGQTIADVPGYVGARFESIYGIGSGMALHPFVSLAYLHEFAPQRNLQNGFIALPGSTFLVSGARPSYNAAQTKAGFDLDMGHGVGLFATFDGEFSNLERVYGGRGGLRYTW